MPTRRPILLVEDDFVDAMTLQRAFQDLGLSARLLVRGNGEEALQYLRDGSLIPPAYILLDLNMPRMNGLELLQAIKQDPALRIYPVVVLTTSHNEMERRQAFELGAAGYMVKPVDYPQFVELIRVIDRYWSCSETPD